MKKPLNQFLLTLVLVLGLIPLHSYAQMRTNGNTLNNALGEHVFLDASSYSLAFGPNVGKGIGFPRTDLTQWVFRTAILDGIDFETAYDGLIVYNVGTGTTLAGQGQQVNVAPGFYYFQNPGATTSITNGRWVLIGEDAATEYAWSLVGNTSLATTTFLGTTDAQPIRFKTNNIQRAIITPTGNIGVGTASPTQTLTVSGSAQITAALHDSSGDTGTNGQVLSSTGTSTNWISISTSDIIDEDGDTQIQVEEGTDDDTLRFDTAGTERLVIDNTGNVGIGTNAPTQKLDVIGNAEIGTAGEEARIGNVGANNWAGFAHKDRATLSDFALIQQNTGRTHVNAATGQLIGFSLGNVEQMRLDSNGNFGIGTLAPLTQLSVGPDLQVDNDPSYHEEALLITSNATPTSDTVLNDPIPLLQLAREGTSGQAWGALANFSLSRFANDVAEANTRLDIDLADTSFADAQTVMTLLADGNVGIGTTTPSETLSVNGNARITGALHDSSGDAGSTGQVLSSTATGTNWVTLSTTGLIDADLDTQIQVEETTDDDTLRFDTAGTERLVIDNNGDIGIGINPSGNFRLEFDNTLNNISLGSFANTTANAINNGFYPYSIGNLADGRSYGIRLSVVNNKAGLAVLTASTNSGLDNFISFGRLGASSFTDASIIEFARFDAETGNFGIGTTTPTETLTVNGSTQITGALHDSSGDAGSNGQVLSSTAAGTNWVSLSTNELEDTDGDTQIQVEEGTDDDTLRFDTAGTERLVIDNTGNVGIGTNTPAEKLVVQTGDILVNNNTVAVRQTDIGTAGLIDLDNVQEDLLLRRYLSSTNQNGVGRGGALIDFQTTNGAHTWTNAQILGVPDAGSGNYAGGLGFATSLGATTDPDGAGPRTRGTDPQIRMLIQADGDVGIGTINPAQTLTVSGSTQITGALHDSSGDAGSNGQVLSSTAAGTNWVNLSTNELEDTDGDTQIQVEEGTDDDTLRFDTAGTERVVIDQTGNVGIATGNPSAPLDIAVTAETAIELDNGQNIITIHDGSGNFNFKSGVDDDNLITATTGGSHIQLDENGYISLKVDESTAVGSAFTTGLELRLDEDRVQFLEGDAVAVGSSRSALTVQTPNNALDAGLAFQNSGGFYTGSIYRTTELDMVFATGSEASVNDLTERLRITETGNIGIGTNNPAHTLTVSGTAQITGALHDSSGDAGSNGQVLSSTAAGTNWVTLSSDEIRDTDGDTKIQVEEGADDDRIRFDTRGAERAVITNTGNVGIGTSTPHSRLFLGDSDIAGSSTAAVVEPDALVIGSDRLLTNGTNINVPQPLLQLFRRGTLSSGPKANFGLSRYTSSNTNANSRLDIQLADLGPTSSVNVMTLLANGNVGIGAFPTASLHVDGDLRVEDIPAANNNSDVLLKADSNGNLRSAGVDYRDIAIQATALSENISTGRGESYFVVGDEHDGKTIREIAYSIFTISGSYGANDVLVTIRKRRANSPSVVTIAQNVNPALNGSSTGSFFNQVTGITNATLVKGDIIFIDLTVNSSPGHQGLSITLSTN